MTTPIIVILVFQGLIFAAWTFAMFRAIFGILGRHRKKTGKMWIGPIEIFSVYGGYLKDPDYRREKLTVLFLTVLFGGVTVLFAVFQT